MFHLHCKSVKCELDVELFPFDERYPEGQKYLVMIYLVRIFFFQLLSVCWCSLERATLSAKRVQLVIANSPSRFEGKKFALLI